MKYSTLLMILVITTLSACSQSSSSKNQNRNNSHQSVGGGCEGCEAIYESPVEFDKLPNSITLPGYDKEGPRIEISGIVYHRNGKTPAADIVIYVYHTDQAGIYPGKGDEKGWGKRHGYIRGWVKTDKNGFYQFYTIRPAAYPGRRDPQHIHITVKEPDKNEYWIDEYVFDDDPLLTNELRKRNENRGGSGVIKLVPQPNGIAHGTRHIILGWNVPAYPYAGLPKMRSGLPVGAKCPAFDPLHLSGPDIGKTTCPMCKYGYGQGVMVWFNHANLDHMAAFVQRLEKEMEQRGEKNFRVFLIYMNPFYRENNTPVEKGIIGRKIREWCEEQGLKKVAMTWIPSPVDKETAGIFKINPEAKNTVFAYKKRRVAAKWVNIEYDDATFEGMIKIF
jgi:protocatechuate 3,4-dioxygenase beta subunit